MPMVVPPAPMRLVSLSVIRNVRSQEISGPPPLNSGSVPTVPITQCMLLSWAVAANVALFQIANLFIVMFIVFKSSCFQVPASLTSPTHLWLTFAHRHTGGTHSSEMAQIWGTCENAQVFILQRHRKPRPLPSSQKGISQKLHTV